MYNLILLIIVFLAGLYFCANYTSEQVIEGMQNKDTKRCPNILVQKGSSFYLYNSNLAKVPGVNPIEFNSLEEYTEFMDWQRSQGIRCPVLYLQHSYDAQGEPVYKVRPGPNDLQGGLPGALPTHPNPRLLIDATRNDPPYNQNIAPGYDEMNQDIGATTPLDMMNEGEESLLYSPNPMDSNWGGQDYTKSLVDSGYYAGNEVQMAV